MNPPVPSARQWKLAWNLAHDRSCPDIVATYRKLSGRAKSRRNCERTFAGLLGRPIQGQHGRAWLISFDVYHFEQAVALHDRLLDAGAVVLAVSHARGSVWVGPRAWPGQSACLGCWRSWIASNVRATAGTAIHWSTLEGNATKPHHCAQVPFGAAAALTLLTLLRHVLQEIDTVHAAAEHGQPPADPEPSRALCLDLRTLTSSAHRFIAYPECPHCRQLPADTPETARITLGTHARRSARDARAPNPMLSLQSARALFVDGRTGLIHHVFQDLASDMMPMCVAEMPIIGTSRIENGYGRSDRRARSELIAVLESLERFAAHAPRRTSAFVYDSYGALRGRYGEQVMDPRDFILHDPLQAHEPGYDLVAYDDALPFHWCWGWSMRRASAVLVPQQLACYRLGARPGQALNRFVYDSSSGCAMGGSIEEAILFGLYELIERDAYFTTWYSRLSPVSIDLHTCGDARVEALVSRATAEGYQIRLLDIRHDIDVPVIWALIVDPRDDAPVKSYSASAAHRCWGEAAYSALVEVVTAMSVYRRSMPARRQRALALWNTPSLVQGMSDHVLLYSLPQSFARLSFLFDGPSRPLGDPDAGHADSESLVVATELIRLIEKTLLAASDVIVVNLGFPALARLGLHAVKVLAPGLLPVTFGQQHRRIDFRRLDRAAGLRGKVISHGIHNVNLFPHNFP